MWDLEIQIKVQRSDTIFSEIDFWCKWCCMLCTSNELNISINIMFVLDSSNMLICWLIHVVIWSNVDCPTSTVYNCTQQFTTIKYMYMYIVKCDIIRFKLRQWLGRRLQNKIQSFVSKNERIFKVARVFNNFFINVALTLIGYRTPSKLFITSTSLVPVTFSTRI